MPPAALVASFILILSLNGWLFFDKSDFYFLLFRKLSFVECVIRINGGVSRKQIYYNTFDTGTTLDTTISIIWSREPMSYGKKIYVIIFTLGLENFNLFNL